MLLITKEKFENMKNNFIENNYASPRPTDMDKDVRFAEFTGVKDIILRNKRFHFVILNDYEKKESTLITYEKIDYDEVGREEFTFNSFDDFYSKLNEYKKYLSKENGTIQAIDYIYWCIFLEKD